MECCLCVGICNYCTDIYLDHIFILSATPLPRKSIGGQWDINGNIYIRVFITTQKYYSFYIGNRCKKNLTIYYLSFPPRSFPTYSFAQMWILNPHVKPQMTEKEILAMLKI